MSRTRRRSPRMDLDPRTVNLPASGLLIDEVPVTPTAAEINKLAGLATTSAELGKLAGITGYPLQCAEVTFTETAGSGVYTGSVTLPAGATLVDIIIHAVALWNNAGACTMKVGDVADDDGFFTGIDLKATDLLAGESLSFSHPGGKQGADLDAIDVGGEGGAAAGADVHVRRRYLATARVISGIITTASTGGSTGRTRMTVLYSLPVATAATKV